MPIDNEDEDEEIDDGSAGGAVRWSPDNVILPPATAKEAAAPVSWETLFSAAAAPAESAEKGQEIAETHAEKAAELPQGPVADPLFSKGPGVIPARKQEDDFNPFTTPEPEPQENDQKPAPIPAPAPTAAKNSQGQALGFNPAPSFSSSSDSNPAAGGPAKSDATPVQYFTAEDIEEEINREQGITTKTQATSSSATAPAAASPPEAKPAAPPFPTSQFGSPSQSMTGSQSAVPSPFVSPFQAGSAAQEQSGLASQSGLESSARTPQLSIADILENEEGHFAEGEESPDLSQVPEIETGRIWEQRSSKEILMGILKAKKADYAVALLASTDGTVQGEMLIVKSVVIHGAKLVEPDLSGYAALKVMLGIPHGTYTLLDVTDYAQQAKQLEQGLNIRITPLANALPNLPDSVDELMGASQISRIRSKEPLELEAEEKSIKPPKQQGSLREKLPPTNMLVLYGMAVLALIMMVIVLYIRR